ncbi:ferrous iron transport protein A [Candidatus Pacearchaeota archaeon]|nr:ferrous iron transport protein A [Candidatus Pacearchaeota archaeon]
MTEIPFYLADEGKTYYVSRIAETDREYGHGLRQRLIDFQIIPGNEISILKKGNLKNPYVVKVGASKIILCARFCNKLLLCENKEDLEKIRKKY